MDSGKYFTGLAGLGGFLGVVLGALAAHKAHDLYTANLLQEAALYQLAHSAVLLTLSQRSSKWAQAACVLFVGGMALFCGGLSLKAMTGLTIGPLIPIGGSCLMLGWLATIGGAFTKKAA